MADKEFLCTWNLKNIQQIPLVNPDKVLMPPLYIKLGLMKNFVIAMAKNSSNGFEFPCKKFPRINTSQAERRRNLYWSTDLESFEDPEFEKALNTLKLQAWQAFKWLCLNLVGNFKSTSFQGVAELLASYKKMRSYMSLKMHFLLLHLELFS